MNEKDRITKFWVSVPVFGICVFTILYFVAAFYYPGGSQADKTARSFSWVHNYWCDLLSEQAKNGQSNRARPIAIVAWLILCFSLSVFWYFLPRLFSINERGKKIIQGCGITAMLIAAVLFTSIHDMVIQLAGLSGFIAFTGAFIGLYKTGLYGFFYSGLFCFALMCLNYGIMVGNTFISYLPLIQKLTFIIVLVWIILINWKLISLPSRNIH